MGAEEKSAQKRDNIAENNSGFRNGNKLQVNLVNRQTLNRS